MGKIVPDLAGAYKSSIGNVVYYMSAGQNYARAKSKATYTSNTPAQREQRDKFGSITHLSSMMLEAAELGFPQRKRTHSAVNVFCSENQQFCSVVEGVAMIDYEKLKCSKGSLFPSVVDAVVDSENKAISLTCEPTEGDTANCKKDDVVYAVLFDKKNEFCNVIKVCNRGEGGDVLVKLMKYSSLADIVIYTFTVTADKKRASNTLYVELT